MVFSGVVKCQGVPLGGLRGTPRSTQAHSASIRQKTARHFFDAKESHVFKSKSPLGFY